jgi:hypothetical protein
LVPESKGLPENPDHQVSKDLLGHKDLLENKGLLVSKELQELKDRPDLLGLLGVDRVKVLQKDTLLAFYRSMAQEDTFLFTPVSNRKESDA